MPRFLTISKNINSHSQDDLFEAGEVLYQYFIGLFLGNLCGSEIQNANINIGYQQERIFLIKVLPARKSSLRIRVRA
jgi:hypothetical protein